MDPQPTTEAADPQPTNAAVSSTGGFLDAELDGLAPKETQVVIKGRRLTDKQLSRALVPVGADTTVNATQVRRKPLHAARRAQDGRVRSPEDQHV